MLPLPLASCFQAPRLAATQTLVADVLQDQAGNAPSESYKQPEAQQQLPGGPAKPQQLEQALQRCSPLMVGLHKGRDASPMLQHSVYRLCACWVCYHHNHCWRCSLLGVQTYCLRRLAKGLGSSRDASRQGFATALAALLDKCGQESGTGPVVGYQEALTLLDRCIESAGGSAKGGVGHSLLGWLLDCAYLLTLDSQPASACAQPGAKQNEMRGGITVVSSCLAHVAWSACVIVGCS